MTVSRWPRQPRATWHRSALTCNVYVNWLYSRQMHQTAPATALRCKTNRHSCCKRSTALQRPLRLTATNCSMARSRRRLFKLAPTTRQTTACRSIRSPAPASPTSVASARRPQRSFAARHRVRHSTPGAHLGTRRELPLRARDPRRCSGRRHSNRCPRRRASWRGRTREHARRRRRSVRRPRLVR